MLVAFDWDAVAAHLLRELVKPEAASAEKERRAFVKRLRMEIRSKHYSMVNADTACHQLYGFKVALEQLGLLDESKCFVYPDHFKEKEADNHG